MSEETRKRIDKARERALKLKQKIQEQIENGKAKKCGCNKRLHYVVCTANGHKGRGGKGFIHKKTRKC